MTNLFDAKDKKKTNKKQPFYKYITELKKKKKKKGGNSPPTPLITSLDLAGMVFVNESSAIITGVASFCII